MTFKLNPMIRIPSEIAIKLATYSVGLTVLTAALSACGSSSDGGITGTGGAPTMVADNSASETLSPDVSGGDSAGDTVDNTDGGEQTDNSVQTDTSEQSETQTDNNTNTGDTNNTTSSLTGGSAGLLNTGTPTFEWNAVDGADAYQITLTEAEGNKITYNASTALCAGSACSASPTAAFHNNSISWQVDALVGSNGNNSVLQQAANGDYTTPRSFDLTPVTNNEAICSIWPSISYEDVIILNNIWNAGAVNSNAWTQDIAATESDTSIPVASWTYDWLAESDGDRTAVKAYPEIIYGNKLGTHVSAPKEVTGLPEIASNLPEFTVDFAFTETFENDVERNVALESFFHSDCNITGPCDLEDNRAYEMMVWVVNPESNRPGDLAVTGVSIDNRLWDVYIKPRSDKKYIAFTAQTPFTEGSLQWNRFVEWTMQWTAENADTLQINTLTPNLCMAAIEMGTELWWGKGSFTLDKFEVTRNN